MNWKKIESENELPKTGREFLTCNHKQGGVLMLVSWNKIHKHWQSKGVYVSFGNIGTHWVGVDKPQDEHDK